MDLYEIGSFRSQIQGGEGVGMWLVVWMDHVNKRGVTTATVTTKICKVKSSQAHYLDFSFKAGSTLTAAHQTQYLS